MTDHSADRAEQALREAFERRAGVQAFVPLDPADLARAASGSGRGRRRAVGWLAAAASVVVLAVPVGVWLGERAGPVPSQDAAMSGPAEDAADRAAGSGPDAAGSGPDAAGSGPAGAGEAAPEAAPGAAPDRGSVGVASAGEGVRTERLLDVVVEVPEAWGSGDAPGDGWCAEPGWVAPDGPFVDVAPGDPSTPECAVIAEADRRPHVTARPGALPGGALDSRQEDDGWVGLSRAVADAVVTVWVPAGDEPVAERILASAREA